MSLGYLRVLTAGESHGPQLTIFVQNLPAGMPVRAEDIDVDLARRQRGYGRGGRQQIEHDCVEIVAGVRHGVTMGGPIAMVVKNRDWANWQGRMDIEPVPEPPPPVTRLRPGHADLAGVVKYGLNDVRNVLERASARETAARVAAGGLAKIFLRHFGIEVRSHSRSIGTSQASVPAELETSPGAVSHDWWQLSEDSPIRTGDKAFEEQSIELIKAARTAGNTLGGVFEVIAYGVPIGLGTYGQWDERIDGRLAAAMMSIQSIKGVEIGDAFANSARHGSDAHDVIDYDPQRGWVRPTNHAGGLEGGVTNGAPLIVRAAAKPISTLINPLPSVDYATRERDLGHVERSDVCVIPAAGVVGEAMVAIVLADAMRLKFGGDSLDEALTNYRAFQLMPDNLVLVGFSCSGKTTLGRNVARRLRMPFVDSDRLIEETTGRTIPDIFRDDGEAAFRRYEREALERILSEVNQVVSTGGGAFVDPRNRDLLRDRNLVIHLQVRPETVVDRLRNSRSGRPRPLLEHPDPLQRVIDLMADRKTAYSAAHVTIGVDDRSRYEIVGELRRRWLAWQRAHHPGELERDSASALSAGR